MAINIYRSGRNYSFINFSSIFMRDTKNSTLCSSSSQLRLRDCKSIHLFVGAESEPIIEASQDIQIGPYPLYYAGIDGKINSKQ